MHRNTGRVDLREARVCEYGAFLIALPCGRAVRVHRVGRQEEDVAVSARSHDDRMGAETLDLARHQIARDDTPGLAIDHDQLEHLVAGIAFDGSGGDLTVQRGIGAQQQLLSGLTPGIERTRYLRTAERTVRKQSAVLAGERNALSDALVDDRVRHLGQTVYVRLAGPVVAALDRIVEQAVYRVVVVLVVLRSVDTALCGDAMRATRRIADAEYLDVVSQFAERSGGRSAAQAGAYDDDVEFSLVGGADHLDRRLMLAPFFGQRPLRSFRF